MLWSHRVKTEDKPTVLNNKKISSPELNPDGFEKPQNHLSKHMLESVKVCHHCGRRVRGKLASPEPWTLCATLCSNSDRVGYTLGSGAIAIFFTQDYI